MCEKNALFKLTGLFINNNILKDHLNAWMSPNSQLTQYPSGRIFHTFLTLTPYCMAPTGLFQC